MKKAEGGMRFKFLYLHKSEGRNRAWRCLFCTNSSLRLTSAIQISGGASLIIR